MKKLLVATALMAFISAPFAMAAGNAKKIADGKFLYEDWGCTACHGFGPKEPAKNADSGPDLQGLYSRRTSEWVKKFVKNPAAMLEAGDKHTVEMEKKYGKIMKTFRISDSEWDSILEYIKSRDKK